MCMLLLQSLIRVLISVKFMIVCAGKKADYSPIEYPKPDGKISFDLLSNLQRRWE